MQQRLNRTNQCHSEVIFNDSILKFIMEKEAMCDKCRCNEREYNFDTDTFKVKLLSNFSGSESLCLVVECPEDIHPRGHLILARLEKEKGLVGVSLHEDQIEWLEENFEFKFNPITNEIMFS